MSKHLTIECGGCRMTTMAKGDIRGWKPVAIPGGQQVWFCDKSPCQQKHDELLAQAMSGRMPIGMTQNLPLQPQEAETLRQRVIELEAELAQLRKGQGQSTASEPTPPPTPAHIAKQAEASKKPVMHVDDRTGKALCGAAVGPEAIKLPEDLAFNDVPCDDCLAEWTANREGKTNKPTATQVMSEPPPATAVVPEVLAEVLPAPEAPRPEIADYSKLPKFTPDLIARVNDGADISEPILLLPSAYPNMDLSKVKPVQLKNGIGAFFTKRSVAWIDRAEENGKFIGIVFQLKAIGEQA